MTQTPTIKEDDEQTAKDKRYVLKEIGLNYGFAFSNKKEYTSIRPAFESLLKNPAINDESLNELSKIWNHWANVDHTDENWKKVWESEKAIAKKAGLNDVEKKLFACIAHAHSRRPYLDTLNLVREKISIMDKYHKL